MSSLYSDDRRFNWGALFILLVAIGLAGGGVGSYLYLKRERLTLDGATLCPNSGELGRTILLLDVSDPLSSKQKATLSKLLTDLRNPETSADNMRALNLRGGTRYIEPHYELVAYSLRGEGQQIRPLLRVCNPGNPDQHSRSEKLTQNKRRALARWTNFQQLVVGAFENEKNRGGAPNSPLLETISVIVEEEADSTALRASDQGKPTRLIVFSDMIQHSSKLSHFRNNSSWSEIHADNRYASIMANLRSVEVVIFYLRRDAYASTQSSRHYKWWQEAISGMGGQLIYIEPI